MSELMYDDQNVFAKILRGELPAKKIYEDENVLCFEDIAKCAPIHWLIIPKTPDRDFSEFIENNSPETVSDFFATIRKIAKENNLDEPGYKLLTNRGKNAGQIVFHFHVHLISGIKNIGDY